ncbi:MAG: acyl transferase [Gemmatimonadaceae bacterium]|nr:acyl transferase [Chitinophagaceae bacterium]
MPGELPNITSEGIDKIFHVQPDGFESLALEIFRYQYASNDIYGRFADAVGRGPQTVHQLQDIPFLPISFFKTHRVTAGDADAGVVFESSGTTGSVSSRHFVLDPRVYEKSFMEAFSAFYGDPSEWTILCLLPSYLERKHSSLVLMAEKLIQASGSAGSGFYLYEHDKLRDTLLQLETAGAKTLLLGVSFALLDFAEANEMKLIHTTVMETGGMKGRREEWTRERVHGYLKQRLGVGTVHSEYGMTELLSQAYSVGDGIFVCPPWMRIMLREEDDPLTVKKSGNGIINVIDLANIHSCSFIATDDAGKLHADRSFEVIGRVDHSDLRGCSLMAV